MEIWERIRYFRKDILNMTQADFAYKVKISRSNLGNIETGRISITDRLLTDICNAFSLSEQWLRTGEGEMYEETETTLFNSFAKQYDLSEAEQRAARYLLNLTSEERQQILHHIVRLAEAITSTDQKVDLSKIDKELAAYKEELLAAEKGLSASEATEEKDA
ncbi:MAG: helix-turn-helix domain-containing protein [Anaerovibrio sp.]|uniref:helix-turn-helix domain-containing protein n=1 Tax=Anaerovibrio sp. TaxID=1872532 RepID=UPI001B2DCFB5|nr:helix-turn-helix transcriptional regulator [Anaerovibrio sp.]MBO6246664.1 helix-turn-helix domain-containing protein [Anaerovibrio sp.]